LRLRQPRRGVERRAEVGELVAKNEARQAVHEPQEHLFQKPNRRTAAAEGAERKRGKNRTKTSSQISKLSDFVASARFRRHTHTNRGTGEMQCLQPMSAVDAKRI
jgi:hypothetical protein